LLIAGLGGGAAARRTSALSSGASPSLGALRILLWIGLLTGLGVGQLRIILRIGIIGLAASTRPVGLIILAGGAQSRSAASALGELLILRLGIGCAIWIAGLGAGLRPAARAGLPTPPTWRAILR